jgi:tRNA uridine 5-carboxymethylaminomethyl modification enzyme
MTSRAEYRLMLRQDNADLRLTPLGYEAGLVTKERYDRLLEKKRVVEAETDRLKNKIVSPDVANPLLESLGSAPIKNSVPLIELLRRPEITYESLAPLDPERPELPTAVVFTVQTEIKYEGYIKKQLADAQRFSKLEKRLLPQDIDYKAITGLSTEAVQKLNLHKPYSIGAASRISGVSPADISVLLIYLDLKNRRKNEGNEA